MKKVISIFLAFTLIVSVFALSGCTKDPSQTKDEDSSVSEDGKNPVAVIKVKNFGTITVELYYDKAPNTVKNFISLANKGFYNGLIFHRVIESFMIQGGCPDGNGTGDAGYSIKGEFSNNGYKGNDISHIRGVISMARAGYSMDSAGSQFFIMHQTSPHLDGDYAAFGMVTDGMDVVDEIASVKTNSSDKPNKDVVIESITINTYGVVYEEPETIL